MIDFPPPICRTSRCIQRGPMCAQQNWVPKPEEMWQDHNLFSLYPTYLLLPVNECREAVVTANIRRNFY
jgi:hypothetical protein